MNFLELPVSRDASGLIECFWYFTENQTITLIPDGVYNIVIGEIEFHNSQLGFRNSRDILSLPLLKECVLLRTKGSVLVLRQKAFVHSYKRDAHSFIESMRDSSRRLDHVSNANQLDDLTHHIARKYSESFYRVPVLTQLINEILIRKGQLSLSEVYQSLNLSKQSVSKTYASWLEISLKELATIWKLNDFLIGVNSSHNLTSAFIDSGFFDQAHGTKYFKKYFRITPLAFLAENEENISSIVSPIQKRFGGMYDPLVG